MAFRGEFVTYVGWPEPRVIHLGEGFSPAAAVVVGWARERITEVCGHLTEEDQAVREVLLAWNGELAETETRARMARGEALIYSFTGAECVWELSLRPVPTVVLPASEAGTGEAPAEERELTGWSARLGAWWRVRVLWSRPVLSLSLKRRRIAELFPSDPEKGRPRLRRGSGPHRRPPRPPVPLAGDGTGPCAAGRVRPLQRARGVSVVHSRPRLALSPSLHGGISAPVHVELVSDQPRS